jgi:hypothetical protein
LRGGNVLLKTFIVGILLGAAAAAGALYAFPVVDQQREVSIITVSPNGGNTESFHINIPVDRIMTGVSGEQAALPVGLKWPDDPVLANVRPEMFKIRNARDVVIGVAVRTVARERDVNVIDWVVHLPARGSLFINMDPVPGEGGLRLGRVRSGSREFEPLTGTIEERWVSDTSGEENAPAGRIELVARLIGSELPPDELTEGAAQ